LVTRSGSIESSQSLVPEAIRDRSGEVIGGLLVEFAGGSVGSGGKRLPAILADDALALAA
jgi:hypothetical protein